MRLLNDNYSLHCFTDKTFKELNKNNICNEKIFKEINWNEVFDYKYQKKLAIKLGIKEFKMSEDCILECIKNQEIIDTIRF